MGSINADRLNEPPDWRSQRTLGQMKAAGWRLATWCKKCGHGAPVDIDHLIELRGADPQQLGVVKGH